LVWGVLSGHLLIGVLWLLAAIVNRWLQAGMVLTTLGDADWFYNTLIYPIRDLLGSILWLASYGGHNFYYRGKVYKLKEGGTVELPEGHA
jgi:ceramide glucosyltransferase